MTGEPERDDPPGPPGRPGLTTFTIEGRAAPALFVVGWLATLLGLGAVFVGLMAGGGLAATLVFTLGLALLTGGLLAAAGSQAIERRAQGGHAWAGPSPVLLFAATFVLAQLLAVGVSVLLSAGGLTLARPVADLLRVLIPAIATIAVVAFAVVGTGTLSWREMGLHRSASRAAGDLAWGAVLAGPVVLLTAVVAIVLVGLFQVTPPSPLPPTGEAGGLVLHLVAGALVAPLAEEILFRGVATTAWVRRYGTWPGIVLAALFFAVAHVLTLSGASLGEALAIAAVAFGGRVPVAIVLGWVYVRRRSLWAPIGLHAAFNAALLVLAHLAIRSGGLPA